jgi:hypothetical protein
MGCAAFNAGLRFKATVDALETQFRNNCFPVFSERLV